MFGMVRHRTSADDAIVVVENVERNDDDNSPEKRRKTMSQPGRAGRYRDAYSAVFIPVASLRWLNRATRQFSSYCFSTGAFSTGLDFTPRMCNTAETQPPREHHKKEDSSLV